MKKIKHSTLNLIFKILLHVTFVIYAIFAIAGPVLLANKGQINNFLGIQTTIGAGGASDGSNTYFNTKFNSMAEVKEASLKIIEETMAEGAVLVKNENDALPLSQGDNVSLYGLASYYTVHVGQGSGGCEANALDDRVTLYDGLTNAGLSVNADLNNWYKGQSAATYLGASNFIGGSTQEAQFITKDIAWDALPASKGNNAKVGIMVLARNSGEAMDLYMDTTMDDGKTQVIINKSSKNTTSTGYDALALTYEEKSVLSGLKGLKDNGTIDNIVVLMNSASPLQCDFLDDSTYGIDACMWVGTIGTNGADAIGKLLTGEYNPSGKLSDTFWANSKYNPVYYNFGAIEYDDSDILKNYYATNNEYNSKFYVAYQEGIYNGYKYTETRYEDVLTNRANAGEFDYSKVVSYPFGYGLSYSTFSYSNMKVSENSKERTYTVSVDVTNNSNVAGKEAVQIYLQKPYTAKDIANGVEKAAVELVGYTKVEVPAKETVTAKIEVQEKYFAAYDANGEKTYVIGSSNRNDMYLLTAAQDAHDAVNNILQYKAKKGVSVDVNKIVANADRGNGNADLVWDKYFEYDATTYSTNEFIQSENQLDPAYEGAQVNYGVDKITNQFDDADFKKAGIFSDSEESQDYMTRNDWEGTYGIRIMLTANSDLKAAQAIPAVEQNADIPYPTYDEIGFYESVDGNDFDEIKLIYLRGKDYNDPDWDILLNRMTYNEYCNLLQNGLRTTKAVASIVAPLTAQQNGGLAPNHSREWGELPKQAEGFFRGFAEAKDPDNTSQLPPVFVCNGIVASTFNTELIERLGEQTGEEAAWAGYNGIYGLGVNIHRGAYCGRAFEYYSEDGFLTGVSAGYEAVGLHKLGVFVLMKHAVLNDQETHRAGLNVWADEQAIREIYCRAIEVAVEIDREYTPQTVLGVMTGMNCLGAKWSGGQGFCNTVLKAEFGMRGYVVSDYNQSRKYMSPVQGVLNGNDLPDGDTSSWSNGNDDDGNSAQFKDYSEDKGDYGELAWAMRDAAHSILYTIANSNAMNGLDGDSSTKEITPTWEIVVPVLTRVTMTLFIWSALAYAIVWSLDFFNGRKATSETTSDKENE